MTVSLSKEFIWGHCTAGSIIDIVYKYCLSIIINFEPLLKKIQVVLTSTMEWNVWDRGTYLSFSADSDCRTGSFWWMELWNQSHNRSSQPELSRQPGLQLYRLGLSGVAKSWSWQSKLKVPLPELQHITPGRRLGYVEESMIPGPAFQTCWK